MTWKVFIRRSCIDAIAQHCAVERKYGTGKTILVCGMTRGCLKSRARTCVVCL